MVGRLTEVRARFDVRRVDYSIDWLEPLEPPNVLHGILLGIWLGYIVG